MKLLWSTSVAVALCGVMAVWCFTTAFSAEPAGSEPKTTEQPEPPQVTAARERAKVMHDLYAATLEVMHERYFHGDRAMVPARALEDVFADIKRQSRTEARWISVNLKPMSVSHEPKTAFEKRAAEEIAAGKDAYEVVEKDVYRRAGAIPLGGECVSCHEGFFKEFTKTPKFAGLVISVPLDSTASPSK